MNKLSAQINQKGFAHVAVLLVALAAVGILAFSFISTNAPLKDQLLSTLYPKAASHASSPLTYNGGTYINLHGSGTAADKHTGPNCSPSTGSCYGSKVYRWVCNGRQTNCETGADQVSSSMSLGNPGCDKTVQLDVFNYDCRYKGANTWSCGIPVDYMTWYTGACSNGGNNGGGGTKTVVTCNKRTLAQSQLESELRGAGYPGPWGDINVELAAFNRAACPTGATSSNSPATATLSGPTTGTVGQPATYTSNGSSPTGVGETDIFIAKIDPVTGQPIPIGPGDIDGYNPSNWNCGTPQANVNCSWYKIGQGTPNAAGSFNPKTPGRYVIITSVIPKGPNEKTRVCSNNPFVKYPITTGGYTFYNCNTQPIYINVSPKPAATITPKPTTSSYAPLISCTASYLKNGLVNASLVVRRGPITYYDFSVYRTQGKGVTEVSGGPLFTVRISASVIGTGNITATFPNPKLPKSSYYDYRYYVVAGNGAPRDPKGGDSCQAGYTP